MNSGYVGKRDKHYFMIEIPPPPLFRIYILGEKRQVGRTSDYPFKNISDSMMVLT